MNLQKELFSVYAATLTHILPNGVQKLLYATNELWTGGDLLLETKDGNTTIDSFSVPLPRLPLADRRLKTWDRRKTTVYVEEEKRKTSLTRRSVDANIKKKEIEDGK